MKNDIFLAFTKEPMYCQTIRHKNVLFLEQGFYDDEYIRNFNLVESPNEFLYLDYNTDKKIIDQAIMLSSKIIHFMAPAFNKHNGVNYSSDYWLHLMEFWAVAFFKVLLTDVLLLKRVKAKYKKNNIVACIANNIHSDVVDYNDFVNKIYKSYYNVELFGKLIQMPDYNWINKEYVSIGKTSQVEGRRVYSLSVKNKISDVWHKYKFAGICKAIYNKMIKSVYSYDTNKVIFAAYNTPFDSNLTAKLLSKYKNAFGYISFKDVEFSLQVKKDVALREKLFEELDKIFDYNAFGDIDKHLLKIFIGEIPLVYLEGYKDVTLAIKEKSLGIPRYIFSAQGWRNPIFLFWAMMCSDKYSTKLIGYQHGGNYGFVWMQHEWVDFMYTWGWKHFGQRTDYIKGTSEFKMHSYRDVFIEKPKMLNDQILFVGTSCDITNFGPIRYEGSEEYIRGQKEFFKHLCFRYRKKLLVRNFMEDGGWKINKQVKEYFPEIVFDIDAFYDARGCDLPTKLMNCKLVVCDHLSSVFLEALYVNKPVIGFIADKYDIFYDEEYKYVNMMVEQGIFFYSGKEAAEAVNAIYGDIDTWWRSSERQKIVQILRKRYLNPMKEPEQWWLKEIQKYMN